MCDELTVCWPIIDIFIEVLGDLPRLCRYLVRSFVNQLEQNYSLEGLNDLFAYSKNWFNIQIE